MRTTRKVSSGHHIAQNDGDATPAQLVGYSWVGDRNGGRHYDDRRCHALEHGVPLARYHTFECQPQALRCVHVGCSGDHLVLDRSQYGGQQVQLIRIGAYQPDLVHAADVWGAARAVLR
eukprot:2921066-Rhodomonas_salina.2